MLLDSGLNIRRLLMRGMTVLLVAFFALFSLATYLVVLRPSLGTLATSGMRDASLPLLVAPSRNAAMLWSNVILTRQVRVAGSACGTISPISRTPWPAPAN